MADPFLKNVGGKRKLADRILAHRPATMTRYIEPFVGGGAVFFAIRQAGFDGPALLADIRSELIAAYHGVQSDPAKVIRALRGHENSETHFYAVRAMKPTGMSVVERAARFIYLNKTAFNGLWRENKSGGMNAPFGFYENPPICDEPKLYAAHEALKNTRIICASFDDLWLEPEYVDGSFIYCDPPYLPVSPTANFTSYAAGGFSLLQHQRLVGAAWNWSYHGATVVLSNADVPLAAELYGDEFAREHVQMARAINSNGDKRAKVGELILRIAPKIRLTFVPNADTSSAHGG